MPNESARQPLALIITEDRTALAAVLAALAVLTGSVLTWATVPLGFATQSIPGLEANGKITIVLGLLGLALVVVSLRVRGNDLPVAAGLVGLAAAGVAFVYLRDIKAATAQVLERVLNTRTALDPDAVSARFGAQAGAGVWVVLAGGLVLAGAAIALLLRDRGATAP